MWPLRIEARLAPFALLLAFVFGVGPPVVRAQSLPELESEQEGLAKKPGPGEWSVTIGAGLVSRPRYQGADTSRVRLAPLALIRYDNFFLGPLGLGWAAIDSHGLRAGPVLGLESGRRESADPHLYGLGNVSRSLTAGAFAQYRFEPFEIAATLRQAITTRANGLNGLVRFEYQTQIVPQRWELRVGPHLDLANAQYEQTHFGVSPLQSEMSGLPVFTPGGGLKDVGLRAALTYFSAEHLVFRAFADVNRLMGDTADSPVVLKRTQRFFGVGLGYHF